MDTITKEEFFNSNEIYLLQNYEANLVELNLKIAEQENKKTQILCFLDTLSKTDTIPRLDSHKDYLSQIDKISEILSNNMQTLTSLKNLLIEIKDIFVSLSRSTGSSDYDKMILKNKVDNYLTSYEKIKSEITFADIKIDNFIKKIDSLDSKKTYNTYSTTSNIRENMQDNNTLIISEKERKVFLPYTVSEIKSYMEKYPKEYKSFESVVSKEFILPIGYYTKRPSLSRFREAYSLIRDREAKSVFDALKYGLNVMFKYNLNPAIISACKTEDALNFYIECLESGDLSKFDLFKIEFRLNPAKAPKFKINV